MKLTLMFYLLMASMFCNAQGRTGHDAKMGEVVVKGKIGNIHPPMQLWIYIGNEKWDTIPINNGQFEYRKKTLLPAYGAMKVNYLPIYPGNGRSSFDNMTLISMFFEEGTMTVISPDDSLRTKETIVKGSANHKKYVAYLKKEGEIVLAQKALAAEFNKATSEQLQSQQFLADYEKKMEALNKKWDALIQSEIKRYPNSLHTSIAYSGYLRRRSPDDETARRGASLFAKVYKERYLKLLDAKKKPKPPVVVINKGDTAPAFSKSSVSGKQIQLSDFNGKYLLLDFWASWCKPCRKVNPDLVKLYDRYKGDAFDILGVSLDNDKQKWEEAIRQDGLPWKHVSDLQGWKSDIVSQYGIGFIPQNFVLDKEGRVIAKNVNIRQLDSLLGKVLQPATKASTSTGRVKAFPFELKDTLGKLVTLDDFTGKVVFMDFWFTGCKGCVQMAKGLHDKVLPVFKGDTNVVFLAVSLDVNFLQWKKSIRAGVYTSPQELNLFTMGMGGDHPLYKHYGFSGAPHTLLIDREGYVVSTAPPFPGPELVALIKNCM